MANDTNDFAVFLDADEILIELPPAEFILPLLARLSEGLFLRAVPDWLWGMFNIHRTKRREECRNKRWLNHARYSAVGFCHLM